MTEDCKVRECPVNGGWSTWESWSECVGQCGDRKKTRTRHCNSPYPAHQGLDCAGNPERSAQEDYDGCKCYVSRQWEAWSSWSSCSKSCGIGEMSRTRTCSKVPKGYSGSTASLCSNDDKQTLPCNTNIKCPVHGSWSAWVDSQFCSATCGTAIRQQNRTCSNPNPKFGGNPCIGNTTKIVDCEFIPCPSDDKPWGEWSPVCLCKDGTTSTMSRSRQCKGGSCTDQQACNCPKGGYLQM